MATRRPLYWDGTDLRQMSDDQIDLMIDYMLYQYNQNPSVTLSVVSSGGNITPNMTDTRSYPGAEWYGSKDFPNQGYLDNTPPGYFDIASFDRISRSVNYTTYPSASVGEGFPIYYDSNTIRPMSLTDMGDTFVFPMLQRLGGTWDGQDLDNGGTYYVYNGTSLANADRVSTTPVFIDTRTSPAHYTQSGVGTYEDQSFPPGYTGGGFTAQTFYLYKIRGRTAAPSYQAPLYLDSSGDLREYSASSINTLLTNFARAGAGNRLSYNVNGGGSQRGNMNDTGLDVDDFQRVENQIDDFYYAQMIPVSSASVVSRTNYYLKITYS